jgi:hypothetical protein
MPAPILLEQLPDGSFIPFDRDWPKIKSLRKKNAPTAKD